MSIRAESAALHWREGTLLERLRFRATLANVNKQEITAALHREAAAEIEELSWLHGLALSLLTVEQLDTYRKRRNEADRG